MRKRDIDCVDFNVVFLQVEIIFKTGIILLEKPTKNNADFAKISIMFLSPLTSLKPSIS
jgi:hypothetical protein